MKNGSKRVSRIFDSLLIALDLGIGGNNGTKNE